MSKGISFSVSKEMEQLNSFKSNETDKKMFLL